MRSHGGYTTPKLTRQLVAPPLAYSTPPSYRNLFGAATPTEQFKGYGFGESELCETKRLLEALAYRMCCPYPWHQGLERGAKDEENPNLPSGYTYFAQLIAHDLSFVGVTRPQVANKPLKDRNFRAIGLTLDAVYGSGPAERPIAYSCSQGVNGPERHRLRLGYFRKGKETVPIEKSEALRWARDLPRARYSFVNDERAGHTDVLIADPRNDDQPIIAQVFVLFSLLHNAACDLLPASGLDVAASHDDLHMAARKVVTFVYRRIIEQDFLERLLEKTIYDRYVKGGDLLDSSEYFGLPIEFSHAAYRFGHAMVRGGYQFNDDNSFDLPAMLRENSTFKPMRMPLPTTWIIQWSHFFCLTDQIPNLSRRIAPSMAESLFDSSQFDGLALAHRDLLRGAAGMRSLDSLVSKLSPHVRNLPTLLTNVDARRSAIDEWLSQTECEHPYCKGAPPLTENDRAVLAADPPLLFFILLEAAKIQNGERLGILGSVIVAEVIFAALRDDPLNPDPARQGAQELADRIFNGQIPGCMKSLITFLENHYEFRKSNIPFI